MPPVNRYTQMPQPLMINPMSFEQLSKVPLAEAQAKAEGVAAINRVNTDYNVDQKDLGFVTKLIEGIDKTKNTIVEDIANNGVTTQTVADVINLKKQRDDLYKNQINLAEENKKRVEIWKQQVDQAYAKDAPWYAQLVKDKEYNKGWQGSFDENGNPQTFQKGLGEKYYDVKSDFFEFMGKAQDMTQVNEKGANVFVPGGGMPQQIQAGGMNYMVTQNSYKKSTLSNEDKLRQVAESLIKEYNDPNTERGKFKQYAEMSDDEIYYQAQQAYDAYKRRIVEEQGGGKSYSDATPIVPDTTTAVVNLENRESLYKIADELKSKDTGQLSNIVQAADETKKAIIKENENKPIISWNKADLATDFFIPGLSLVRTANIFVDKLGEITKGSESDQREVIGMYNTVGDYLVNSGKLNSTTYYMSKQPGAKYDKYRTAVIGSIKDYVKDHLNPVESPSLYTEDYMRTNYGLKIAKVSPEEDAQDITKGGTNFMDVRTRKIVPAKKNKSEYTEEHSDILKSIAGGKAETQGVIPMFSPDLLDENGEYIEDMASAKLVYITDPSSPRFGNKYYVKQPEYVRKSPEFIHINRINRAVVGLKPGQKTGMVLLDNAGNAQKIFVRHDFKVNEAGELFPGDYRVYFGDPSRSGTQSISLIEYPELGNRLLTEEEVTDIVDRDRATNSKKK